MAKRSVREVQDHVKANGGTLVKLTNGNYDIRKGTKSANIGKPGTGTKWEDAQLQRAWTLTGIPKLR
ncbi:MAG TPA: hypothetical protein VE442_16290 [Jatrophihabitans sp.]|jgi:hypothetical protein|nr:hypothetical protein [Jatrophihabitans sp.]